MIKDNQKVFNRLHVLMDVMITVASYALAYVIKIYIIDGRSPEVGVLPVRDYFMVLLFLVPGYVIIYFLCNVYGPKRTVKRRHEFFSIFQANTLGIAFYIIVLYVVIQEINYSRWMMFIFYMLNIFFTCLSRVVLRSMLRTIRRKGYNLKHVLVVGYSRAAEQYIDRLLWNPQWGYKIAGILDDTVPSGTLYKGIKVLGRLDNLEVILPYSELDEVAIALALKDYDNLEHVVNVCEKSGVHTKFIPDYNSVIPTRPYTEDLMGLPVINIRHVPLTNTLNWWMKRMVDILVSLVGLVVASPVMIVSAIAVGCTSRGPVIFKQERIGLHNKPFRMYKFRTMEVQKPSAEKKGWTTKNDPRVTKVGKFLRKTSIDELPQLFNILMGDMSVVGPRPERPQFVEQFKEEIPRYMVKHQVRPGLTGWAQINGYRGDTSIKRRIEFDIFYIENWTMSFDIKIMFLTIFKGFINKNAY